MSKYTRISVWPANHNVKVKLLCDNCHKIFRISAKKLLEDKAYCNYCDTYDWPYEPPQPNLEFEALWGSVKASSEYQALMKSWTGNDTSQLFPEVIEFPYVTFLKNMKYEVSI